MAPPVNVPPPEREGFVTIYHPELDATAEVHEQSVPAYGPSGWRLLDGGKQVKIPEPPGPADPNFDPGQHSVADVVEYLATLNAEGRETVLAAERNGKARAGILSASGQES